jgi:hypothetical protein
MRFGCVNEYSVDHEEEATVTGNLPAAGIGGADWPAEEERSNYKIMKGVNEFTKISVNQSLREIEGYLREMKKSKELMFSVEEAWREGRGM